MSDEKPRLSSLSRRTLFGLLVMLLTGLSYLQALEAGFVWDDFQYVVDNLTLRSPSGLWLIWSDPSSTPQYYPLVYTTFWIEYRFWELDPIGYHATNIILHGLNALLIWCLLRRLSVEGAWLAALIFAVHPVHVESVAWVSERKNVLSAFLYLGSALAYLRFRGLEPVRPAGRWGAYAVALIFFGGALLSKSVTASLPAAILLVIYWKTGRVGLRDMLRLSPFFAVGIAAGLNTAWLERVHVGASGPIWNFSVLDRMLIASRALVHYLTKLFWPDPLVFSYPRWVIDSTQAWQYLYGLGLVVGLMVLFRLRRSRRGPLVATLFFAGTLFPALGFVDLYPMRFSFVADHFQYLANLGVIVPMAAGAIEVGRRLHDERVALLRWLGPLCVAGVMVLLASLTYQRTRIYFDEETLWLDTLSENPGSWMSHNNLGRVYGLRGDSAKAREHFQRTIDLYPEYHIAETNLAEALIQLAEYDLAVDHLRHVVAVDPDYADAHFLLWRALDRLGETEQSISHLRRETELIPGFASHFRASRLLANADHLHEALEQLERAESFRPDSLAIAVDRGNIYARLGNPLAAALYFLRATQLDPASAVAHNRLGEMLEASGKPLQAERQFEKVLIVDPSHEKARANLNRLRDKRLASEPDASIGK